MEHFDFILDGKKYIGMFQQPLDEAQKGIENAYLFRAPSER